VAVAFTEAAAVTTLVAVVVARSANVPSVKALVVAAEVCTCPTAKMFVGAIVAA
jgi:hypothetical protein